MNLTPGKTVVRNRRTGKSGVFLGGKRRDDGQIVYKIKFGRLRVYMNADNCEPVPRARDWQGRVTACTGIVDERHFLRDHKCMYYSKCLGAVSKFPNLRLSCANCRGDTPVNESLCRGVVLGLVRV